MDERVREHFERTDGWRNVDEISGASTTVVVCQLCGWRDEDADVTVVEARAWKHLEDDHPEKLAD